MPSPTVCMGSVIIRRRLSSVVVSMVTQSRFLQAHRQYTVPPDQYYCEETPFVPLGRTGPRAGLGDGAVALWRLLPHRETLPDEPWPKIQPVKLPMLLRTHWPELPASLDSDDCVWINQFTRMMIERSEGILCLVVSELWPSNRFPMLRQRALPKDTHGFGETAP